MITVEALTNEQGNNVFHPDHSITSSVIPALLGKKGHLKAEGD